jgi:uncharacterized protein GlcG (DUF336 family)
MNRPGDEEISPVREKLLDSKPVMTLALARQLLSAAEDEIHTRGFAMYVAIIDDGGAPLVIERVNGAQTASFDISVRKARAAAGFRRPTKVWEERVKGGAPNVMTLPGIIASEGGVPLAIGGVVIGAVGVSGGTGVEDGIVCARVTATLEELLGSQA